MKKIALLSITANGDKIIEKITKNTENDYEIYNWQVSKKEKLHNIVEKIFHTVDGIVFMSSLGICVRVIAPYLTSKVSDPAIICIPNDGSMVISVVGGHLGGANELTKELAKTLKAQPIITTATDQLGKVAPDMLAKEHKLWINSMENCKKMAALIVEQKQIAIYDEQQKIQIDGYHTFEKGEQYDGIIYIGNKKKPNVKYNLQLTRKNIILGIGCRKNYDVKTMLQQVEKILEEYNLHPKAIAKIVSIDIKKEETAIQNLSTVYKVPFQTYTIEEIKKVEHLFTSSEFVKKSIGVGCVAEPCVHLAGGKLIVPKNSLHGMTIAIGES